MINGTVRLLLLKGLCFCPPGTPGQLSRSEHESLAICFLTQNFLESIMNLHFSHGVCSLPCELILTATPEAWGGLVFSTRQVDKATPLPHRHPIKSYYEDGVPVSRSELLEDTDGNHTPLPSKELQTEARIRQKAQPWLSNAIHYSNKQVSSSNRSLFVGFSCMEP